MVCVIFIFFARIFCFTQNAMIREEKKDKYSAIYKTYINQRTHRDYICYVYYIHLLPHIVINIILYYYELISIL